MIGTTVGPYRVLDKIGAGGMGEVYRAHDTKLNRDVAIKVLPASVAADPDRIMRFEREAQVLAALNHPNIAQIFGVLESPPALVMELVTGEDLAARLARGPVSQDEALLIARQIADALETAHEQGIIHRDLKPANVKLRGDGTVKVLDFGLAKDVGVGTDSQPHELATMTSPAMTELGMILGTASYMAPEQAKGRPADKRADIWAFGVVLFELVSGASAFTGESITETIARVIEREPDWSLLPAATSPALRHLLERCLTKNPKSRLRDIGEARHALDELIAGRSAWSIAGPAMTATEPSTSAASGRAALGVLRQGTWIPWSAAAVLAVVAAAAWLGPETVGVGIALPSRPVRVELVLPDNVEFYSSARISPDGRRLVFVGNRDGVRLVFLRELDEANARVLAGTDGAIFAAFSPNSRSVAVITTDAKLTRLSLDTGSIEDLATGVDIVGGLHWTEGDRILFGRVTKLMSVAASGGTARDLVGIAPDSTETAIVGPVATPDGKTVLFTAWSGPPGAQRPRIEAAPIDGGARRVIVENAGYVLAAMSDRLVYQRDNGIYAAPFDPVRAIVTGAAEKLSDEARPSPTGGVAADVSPSGTLLFADVGTFNGRLSWVSLDGTDRPIQVAARAYNNPRVSPDGHTVAYSDASSIWTTDTERGAQTRIFNGSDALTGFPVWSHDGTTLYFRTTSGTVRTRADGGGQPELVEGSVRQDYPNAISPDGTALLMTRILAESSGDIVMIPTKGGAAKVVVGTPAYEGGAQFSPDGRWLTYISNASGRMEVYLRSLEGEQRHQVSTTGGLGALWSPDGKRIFFRSGQQFLAVDVATTPRVSLGAPKVLFERRYSFGPNLTIANYSLSRDGKSFLLVSPGSGHLNLIFNWLPRPSR